MKPLSYKSPNLTLPHSHSHSAHRRRLRIADILLSDEDFMDGVQKTPPSPRSRYSPRRLVAWLLAALKPTKHHRRCLSNATDSETPSSSPITNDLTPGELQLNDASFKVGVGCGLMYLIAASKNEFGKMVELRKEMEMLLQNVKGELESKGGGAILKPFKQSDDGGGGGGAFACSITDVPEFCSSSNSHLSVHSRKPRAQLESKSNMVRNRFLDYGVSEHDEYAGEITELQEEFEFELQRLQLYLDGEAAFEDAQGGRVEVNVKDSCSESNSSSFGEITMEPQVASYDVSFGVPPVELERRLHELLETRLHEHITELESKLECTTQKLDEKELEVTWWKDTARLIALHVPETYRFTFQLDPDTDLKLRQVVG
ncbi:protein POLAR LOCALIZATION DURING ASYMMETRIC DIVISION AND REDISTRIBUTION-like [Lotus japonicus]|uniref:protein POLAR LOCALIZATION DURING ASYMMETRIC DIVISION AND REDISTRIBUTION-like n=1 Tax=Lotus japonicus TaxID=34305 RepID=UPI002583C40D|nr:protein POLAR LOCALIZATION DURING ASYMMETRIC DIVISION AND REDISTRIBUTION-like [Lotus japonicus]